MVKEGRLPVRPCGDATLRKPDRSCTFSRGEGGAAARPARQARNPSQNTIPNLTAGSAQTVTLYFEESYWSSTGQRIFNVAINGTTVLSGFDIVAAAGATNRAIARTFSTTASASGQVVIQFTRNGGPDWPKICGITVAAGGGGGRGGGGSYALTVAKAGTGSGTVASSPAGISCGTACNASFTSGTSVTLTASPASGSTSPGGPGPAAARPRPAPSR